MGIGELKKIVKKVKVGASKCVGFKETILVEVKYYKSFAGYNHPIKLINEIGADSVKVRNNYLKGIYINKKLKVVEKYNDEKLFFRYDYVYERNKLIKVKITDINEEKKKYY